MPIAVGYKHTKTVSLTSVVGVSATGKWPDGAFSLKVYMKGTKDWDVGLIDKYDEGGLLAKDVVSYQHGIDADYPTLAVIFYDANGNELPGQN